ncbi:6-bladed beta-propeller [Roseivirga sp.]|uniref:6-bladed beta-propeller n=1 Tax=Roseivirga sp. TaxID=1964215 RepID=UPI003B8D6710
MDKIYFKLMTRCLGLVIVVFFFGSCSGEKTTQEESSLPLIDGFQSYSLDIKAEDIGLSELIESIEIMRLEETPESLLGYVRQIEFYQNQMIVPGREGNIYIFSEGGDFIRKINRKGEGPEEYSGWNDVWLQNGQICVFTYDRHIKRYDVEGNFISAERVPQNATHLHPFNGGYALDMNYSFTNDSLKYMVTILDNEMKVSNTFLPFEKFPDFGISMSNKSVFPVGDDVFFLQLGKDSVYRIGADSLMPYIHYDFGEDWYFQPGVEFNSMMMVEAEKSGQVWFMNNRIGENYIYLTAVSGAPAHKFFIDRRSKSIVKIDDSSYADQRYGISSIGWDGDDFLFTMQSTQLESLLGKLDESEFQFIGDASLEVIESSENPVLIRMKLKDNLD